MKGCVLILRYLLYLSVELTGAGLVDSAGLFQTGGADSFQDSEHSGGIDIGRKLGAVKTYLYVALGCKVVYFIGLYFAYYLYYTHGVTQVGVVQMEMGLAFQVSYALAVIYTATADYAVNIITFL